MFECFDGEDIEAICAEDGIGGIHEQLVVVRTGVVELLVVDFGARHELEQLLVVGGVEIQSYRPVAMQTDNLKPFGRFVVECKVLNFALLEVYESHLSSLELHDVALGGCCHRYGVGTMFLCLY